MKSVNAKRSARTNFVPDCFVLFANGIEAMFGHLVLRQDDQTVKMRMGVPLLWADSKPETLVLGSLVVPTAKAVFID